MRERLLFVTNGDKAFEEGFSYAIELAKSLNAGVSILLVFSRQAASTYEDAMAAVAFAQAGEFQTAKEILKTREKELRKLADEEFKELSGRYKETQIDIVHEYFIGDVLTAIKDFLKNNSNIDMVLLSPSLSSISEGKALKKLIKNITKPLVAISKPLQSGA